MDRKAVSMWKVTRNLILTDVCAIALYWLIPSAKMLVLLLSVLVRHRIYAVAGTVLPERLQGQSAE